MVLAGGGGTAQDGIELDELVSLTALEIVAHDQRLADDARSAFLRYGKGRHPAALHMGDCATYALAQSRKLPLLFKGGDFSKIDIESATAGP